MTDLYESYHARTKKVGKVIKKNNFTYYNILNFLGKHLKPGMKILDVGCGAGTIDLYLGKIVYEVVGVDISGQAIQAARNTAKTLGVNGVRFFKKNLESESLDFGKFDLIICSEILEHLGDHEMIFKKILVHLRRGGLVMVTVPSKKAPLYRMGLTKSFDR